MTSSSFLRTSRLGASAVERGAALVGRAAEVGCCAGEVVGGILIRFLVGGVILELAACEGIRPALDLIAVQSQAWWCLSRCLVHLQQGFGNLEGLGEQHGCVVPEGLIQQFLRVLCHAGRAVGKIRVIVEVGEDVAGLAAKAGLRGA